MPTRVVEACENDILMIDQGFPELAVPRKVMGDGGNHLQNESLMIERARSLQAAAIN